MYTKNADFAQETANFEFFIASVNRLKPQFVVITGDLTNKAADADQIGEFHRIARKLDPVIKLYNVPGNHDVGNEPTAESLAKYRKNWGADYYTFDCGDVRGIVLDSSLIQAPINVQSEADKQEQWLKSQLAKAKTDAKRVVIFQHIPFFLADRRRAGPVLQRSETTPHPISCTVSRVRRTVHLRRSLPSQLRRA